MAGFEYENRPTAETERPPNWLLTVPENKHERDVRILALINFALKDDGNLTEWYEAHPSYVSDKVVETFGLPADIAAGAEVMKPSVAA